MSDQSAISNQILTLPKGGGAVRGIGETFQPNLFSGTGDFTIPVFTSPGRGGFGPQLSLKYSTGHGNGPFGLGWQLSVPRVTRKTEKGLPRYNDGDVFVISGAEDLVPVLREAEGADDAWEPAAPISRGPAGRYSVTQFRPRTEGLFAKVEKCAELDDRGQIRSVHWRATTKENVTSVYGRTPRARLARDPGKPEEVYEWLLEETFDARGNHILYEYARDNPDLEINELYERERNYCQLYLRRICYGNIKDETAGVRRRGADDESQAGRPSRSYLFEVVFDYGDLTESYPAPHGGQELFGDAVPPLRDDPFSTYRAGFEIRTLRRCRRVLMFHHFQELGGAALVKSTDFEYESRPNAGRVSLLKSVTVTGYRPVADGYRTSSLPPVEFEYTVFKPGEQRYQSVSAPGEDLPPRALNEADYALVDLFGDGLPDVVHAGAGGFRYWRNLGGGALDQPRSMSHAPLGVSLSQPGVGFGDMNGDGRVELLVHSAPLAGYFEATPRGSWENFRPHALPSFALSDPNLRLVDLTGDGLTDALITLGHHFLWFECLGEAGFAQPEAVEREHGSGGFPDLYFDDPSGRVRLADMSGDGLSDLVLLHNGRVEYWPNLGRGKFGRPVCMGNAPALEFDYDPRRLFLVDLDGSGCADLVYVEHDRIHFWLNCSGNGWSERQTIHGTPPVTDLDSVEFADFLGTGTAALVWSCDHHARPGGNYKVLDFCGGIKPHLLAEMTNNMGATTRVRYAPSTKFYLEDRERGEPWATGLPFPVQVVEKVEVIDHVSRSKLVTRYSYHHGFYDGREREFRGFGRVDHYDTEEFAPFSRDDLHQGEDLFSNKSKGHHAPPILTRTWFHTGAHYDEGERLLERYSAEFYRGDTAAFRLRPDEHENLTDARDGSRALRGSVLRTEVYAQDRTAQSAHPYVVTQNRYNVRELQPKGGNAHGSYMVSPKEGLSYHYERDPADPRINQQLTVAVDNFGNVTQSLTIVYPRRGAAARDEQGQLKVVFDWKLFINTPDRLPSEVYYYYAGVACETRSFEVTGARSLWSGSGLLSVEDFSGVIDDPDVFVADERDPPQPAKRLLSWTRTYYRKDDGASQLDPYDPLRPPNAFDHRLGLGQIEKLGLPYESCRAVFTPGLLEAYGGRVEHSQLREAGYLKGEHLDASAAWPAGTEDYWWMPSGQQAFEPGDRGFFQPIWSQDPFGHRSEIKHDRYRLFVESTADALGNQVKARYNYRVLQPFEITDANDNRQRVVFDALGLVAGTAVMSKEGESKGDLLPEDDSDTDFETDLGEAVLEEQLLTPLQSPHAVLGKATTRLVYDLHWYQRHRHEPGRQYNVLCTLTRETHAGDPGGERARIQRSFSYFDGFGRPIQTKIQAEPDPADPTGPRWVSTGWAVYNNKGKPVRQYEPFFSRTHEFEPRRQGVSSTLFYDPLGRLVSTLHPNETYTKVVFGPWRQETWDANDTVSLDPRDDPDVKAYTGEYLAGVPGFKTWYQRRVPVCDVSLRPGSCAAEQDAARKTLEHGGTPEVFHLDSLGRLFLRVADNGSELLETETEFDIQGRDVRITDPRGIVAFTHHFDLVGRKFGIASADAGTHFELPDVAGNAIYRWDANGNRSRTVYDALRRPESVIVAPAGGAEFTSSRIVYGESLGDRAKLQNHRARVYQHFDSAGVVTNLEYDFKGNLLASKRRLAAEYKGQRDWKSLSPSVPNEGPVEWSSPNVRLSNEVFGKTAAYDALNRITSQTIPDGTAGGSRHVLTYNAGGLLQSVGLHLGGSASATPFVLDINYNEKGQRSSVTYANGVSTSYQYEEDTFRLSRIRSGRSDGTVLQGLEYTYDPVGNITRIHDSAFDPVFNSNQRVDPTCDYSYDALYRLAQARGREHRAMSACHYQTAGKKHAEFVQLTGSPINDGQALRNYAQEYQYDPAGNLTRIRHTADRSGGWTRVQSYSAANNRLLASEAGCDDEPAFSYDANGNMLAMPHLAGLVWGHADRLREVETKIHTDVSADKAFYVYDEAGLRVRKVIERGGRPTEERIYLGGFEVYREHGAAGTERRTLHVTDDKRRVALVEIERGQAQPRLRYQLDNHLGSSLLELDEHGNTISYEEHYPYGGTAYLAGDNWAEVERKRYRYSGKELDDESGLYYYGLRYYAPWLGRWLSRDPAWLVDGPNLYLFARNNPVKLKDLFGTSSDAAGGPPLPATDMTSADPMNRDSSGGFDNSNAPPPLDSPGPGESTMGAGAAMTAAGLAAVGVGGLGPFAAISAAMAIGFGIPLMTVGSYQMLQGGNLGAEQHQELNEAAAAVGSLSSPASLLGGAAGAALLGDLEGVTLGGMIAGSLEATVSLASVLRGGGRRQAAQVELEGTKHDLNDEMLAILGEQKTPVGQELLEQVKGVNESLKRIPLEERNNCLNVAVAADEALGGAQASVLPVRLTGEGAKDLNSYHQQLESLGQARWDVESAQSIGEVRQMLLEAGPGSRAIVGGVEPTAIRAAEERAKGHAFNAVNVEGQVYFIDATNMSEVTGLGYFSFIVLRTN